tara:strand:+ start:1713 stop:2414 length:702 start_codon:yes stop_codon:yes gene_type:complete
MQLSQPIYQLKRRAKLLAREAGIPLHAAQDRVAQTEGFASWSLLSARYAEAARPPSILDELADGELALIAARPRQGKTRIGLQLLVDAVRTGRRAVFFTLEYTEPQARNLLAEIGAGDDLPEIVATDAIDAASIERHLAQAPAGTVAVIDYLQVLDQRRNTPPLAEQVGALADFARERQITLAFIAQVDRAFEDGDARLPGLSDIRLPNPLPIELFAKAGFTHGGKIELRAIG